MKKVFIKRFCWLQVLQENGNYALLLFPSGCKICYNILGHETKIFENSQLKMF